MAAFACLGNRIISISNQHAPEDTESAFMALLKRTSFMSRYGKKPAATRVDITGKEFGWLKVLRYEAYSEATGRALWRCRCVCGRETIVDSASLRRGLTRSCGCLIYTRSERMKQIAKAKREAAERSIPPPERQTAEEIRALVMDASRTTKEEDAAHA